MRTAAVCAFEDAHRSMDRAMASKSDLHSLPTDRSQPAPVQGVSVRCIASERHHGHQNDALRVQSHPN